MGQCWRVSVRHNLALVLKAHGRDWLWRQVKMHDCEFPINSRTMRVQVRHRVSPRSIGLCGISGVVVQAVETRSADGVISLDVTRRHWMGVVIIPEEPNYLELSLRRALSVLLSFEKIEDRPGSYLAWSPHRVQQPGSPPTG